mmetsp:Transcript_5402/g.12733  ORF Transcript_5402/g.12733 Transcript_5402/m.12733 type:complete len:649 (-) Transcript_5402:71-2017(-)
MAESSREAVEARLTELEAHGLMSEGQPDESALVYLRNCDPTIALEALEQWEQGSFHTRDNPSASLVSLLKRLNRQGHNLAVRGAVEPDQAAEEQVEELLSQYGDKIDDSAKKALHTLGPIQAASILMDIDQQGDGIRNPSAFIMSAVKRNSGQEGSSSSGRRREPRLEQGPYADHRSDDRHSSYSRRRDNDRGGYDRGDDRGYDRGSTYERGSAYDSGAKDRSSRYNGGAYGSYGSDRNSRYEDGHAGGSYSSGGKRSRYSDYDRGGSLEGQIESLLEGLDIDESARGHLASVPEESQVQLLEELSRDSQVIRNHSAFTIATVKKIKDGKYRPRNPRDSGGGREPESGYSHSRTRSSYHESRKEAEEEARWPSYSQSTWSSLDEKAQAMVNTLSQEAAAALLSELESKMATVNNPSAFVCSQARRYRRYGQENYEDRSSGNRYRAYERQRSRSPRREPGVNLTEPDDYEDADAEKPQDQVVKFVNENKLGLDDRAMKALCSVPAMQAVQVMRDLMDLLDEGKDVRKGSAYVLKACREIAQDAGWTPHEVNGSDGLDEEDDTEVPADWRSMPLRKWLKSVDGGKGFLMQYEEPLMANYDTLEQIMELYVTPPGDDGKIAIDQTFFDDLKVEKTGHKRLFEKWFNDQWDL